MFETARPFLLALAIGLLIGIERERAKADAPEEWTEIAVNSVEYEIDIRDSVFTLSNLRNPRD